MLRSFPLSAMRVYQIHPLRLYKYTLLEGVLSTPVKVEEIGSLRNTLFGVFITPFSLVANNLNVPKRVRGDQIYSLKSVNSLQTSN